MGVYKGYKPTEEHKKNLSKALKGKQNFLGKHHSEETKKEISEALKGSKCYLWKGGRKIDSGGYVLIYKPEHPQASKKNYVREHRLIMEKYLGRYLTREEVVHHINGIVDDNRIKNLKLFKNQNTHVAFHNRLKCQLSPV